VVLANFSPSYGNQVLVDHGFGYKTRYAHLHKILVEDGQEVQRGQLIGTVGNTGVSEGPHLHYEVLLRNDPVNPINFFTDDIEGKDLESILHASADDRKNQYD
jgi:murein DD-endopeptidase MepM/ murein hydrolase activator NlpD